MARGFGRNRKWQAHCSCKPTATGSSLARHGGRRAAKQTGSGMQTRMGGQETLRVLLLGNGQLRDIMLSRADGGQKHNLGLAELVAQKHATTLEVLRAERPSMSRLDISASLSDQLRLADIVIWSLAPDVLEGVASETFLTSATSAIDAMKEHACHVLTLNASTIDPTQVVSNYHEIEEPFTRVAQRLDLALLELSISLGISIIDADRILAELGAAEHVLGPLDYSTAASEALCAETVRIMEDYGFFERRPVMAQIGKTRPDTPSVGAS